MQQDHVRTARDAHLDAKRLLKGAEIRVGARLVEPIENGGHCAAGEHASGPADEARAPPRRLPSVKPFSSAHQAAANRASKPPASASRRRAGHSASGQKPGMILRTFSRESSTWPSGIDSKTRFPSTLAGNWASPPLVKVDQVGADDRSRGSRSPSRPIAAARRDHSPSVLERSLFSPLPRDRRLRARPVELCDRRRCPAAQTRPGSAAVVFPLSITNWPLTSTWMIPSAGRFGSAKVEWSRTAVGVEDDQVGG